MSKVTAAVMVVMGLMAAGAQAQASRTWVSGVGDDANPCSRTAPCKTFAGAISKTAAGGEISVLDPGGYGAVTITKSITIDGGEETASILASGTNGIVINAAVGDTVTLRNLSLNGISAGLNGIRFLAGGVLSIENVEIFGFTQRGISLEPTTNSRVFVRGAQIRNNPVGGTGGGLLAKPAAGINLSLSIADSFFDRNTFGVRIEDGVKATISDTTASGNTNGFFAASSTTPATMALDRCVSSNNTAFGVLSSGSASVLMTNSTVTGNATGLSGAIISFGNNRVLGNTTDGAPSSTTPQI